MGYVLRVRVASFFAGAAATSALGFYILHRDYQLSHQALSSQVKDIYDSLDTRIKALEKLRQTEPSVQADSTD